MKGEQHGRPGRQKRQEEEPAAARDEAETQKSKEAGQGAVQALGRKHLSIYGAKESLRAVPSTIDKKLEHSFSMIDNPQSGVSTANRTMSTLRELIGALDRRVPHAGRPGELRIAWDAEMLRREAVAQIEALNRQGPDAKPYDQELVDAIMTDELGLGLSIARKAVLAHGGDIRVRNLPGRGCAFTIEVPLAAEEVVPHAMVQPENPTIRTR